MMHTDKDTRSYEISITPVGKYRQAKPSAVSIHVDLNKEELGFVLSILNESNKVEEIELSYSTTLARPTKLTRLNGKALNISLEKLKL